ncbi:MAG TPA: N-acetylmuramic acid 6-phosphate etherase [Thermomicrobiales bacterium]|nr:N-acetylmuramic acid 6-phosphate etherase [Thermomicrobiales bacterium]
MTTESWDAGTPDVEIGHLATEQRNPASRDLDLLDSLGIATLINEQDATVASAVVRELPAIARAIDGITDRIRAGGRLLYIGAGTSGRLGVLDASECPPTFNSLPNQVVGVIAGGDFALRHAVEAVEDDPRAGAEALRQQSIGSGDAVVGIAASGRTPFVLGAIAYARENGALTIGLCNTSGSELSSVVDIPIAPVTGPEVLTGSTRMKAGTAQKMVLNMLSTAVMVKLGKTYGNLMVDVQPTNRKLRKRAIGIVAEACEIPLAEAEAALSESRGNVKAAIVARCLDISPEEAAKRLDATSGIVRRALETPPG